MGKKLFVGGISWNTTDETLRQAFEPYGQVSEAKVITDRETGRSRGFGFVTFTDEEAAKAAMNGLNGKSIDGRTVKVNEAEEKSGGRGGFGGPRGGGGGGPRGGGYGGGPGGGGYGGGPGGGGGRPRY